MSAVVSARRITNFMQLGELRPSPPPLETLNCNGSLKKPKSTVDEDDHAIVFDGARAKWCEALERDTLSDISFSLRTGSLVAVIGQIGSGKTSLLQVLLRELPLTSGTMKLKGKVAYTCQESWIFASTIRQNILFGNPMDEERYGRAFLSFLRVKMKRSN